MADEDWCYSYAYFEGEGEDEENENLVKDYDKMIKYAEITYGYQYDFEEDLRQTGELEELHPGLNFEPNNINFFERWVFHSERNIRLDILLNVVGMELVNIDVDELSLYDIQPKIPREIIKIAKQY